MIYNYSIIIANESPQISTLNKPKGAREHGTSCSLSNVYGTVILLLQSPDLVVWIYVTCHNIPELSLRRLGSSPSGFPLGIDLLHAHIVCASNLLHSG